MDEATRVVVERDVVRRVALDWKAQACKTPPEQHAELWSLLCKQHEVDDSHKTAVIAALPVVNASAKSVRALEALAKTCCVTAPGAPA